MPPAGYGAQYAPRPAPYGCDLYWPRLPRVAGDFNCVLAPPQLLSVKYRYRAIFIETNLS